MLIECLECKNEISSRASACPKCGAPVSLPAVQEPKAEKKTARPADTQDERTSNAAPQPNSPDALEAFIGGFSESIGAKGQEALVLRVLAAIGALILFRLFLVEEFYEFVGWVVLKLNASDIEIALGLAWFKTDEVVNGIGSGYIVPFLIFLWWGKEAFAFMAFFSVLSVVGNFFR